MKRCPACGTSFIYGGEFCSMDGTKLISVPAPTLVDSAASEAVQPVNPTLVSGSLPPQEPRPTIPVDEAPTGSLNAGGVTIALGLGDSSLIGAVLADRYKLEAVIGRGGMGVVYRARHLLLDRAVAVKLLRPQYLEDERAVQRFMREAQAMARVEHANAVMTHDFGMMPDGGAYLVMEFIEGETLRAVLSRVGSLGATEAVAVAEQICGAVDAAHRQGVVHRDLKPENIMFKRTDDGPVVKVVDFGLAKVTDAAAVAGKPQLTSAGDLFGTPAYMAPEYFEGEEVGPRTDVYSIGVIVYEMLAGSPPFQGSVQSIMSGHLFKEPPTISDSRPLTPPGVERAVRTALRKRSAERYGTAADFAARLVAGLSGDDFDVENVPTGAITTKIKRDSLSRVSRELQAAPSAPAPDESPTYMGFSPDDVETIGAPGRIPTADILEPPAAVAAAAAVPEQMEEPPEPATESLQVPVAVRKRRRSIPMVAAASVIGAALVGGLVFAMTAHTGSPSIDGAIPQATPDMRALPSMVTEPPVDETDVPAPDETTAEPPDSVGSAPAPPPSVGARPSVSKMEVAPTKSDRATDAGGNASQPGGGEAGNAQAPATERKDAPPADKKAATNDDKADKDKGKKKRKWFNPFSW